MSEDLYRLTALEAVRRLRAGDVTPLDLIDAVEKRAAAVNGAVNALVTPAYERAREHARRLMKLPPAERGLLAGLPVGIKDLSDVAGVRTTYGSPIFADNVPAVSDIMVQNIEAKGGIVVGMTNTPEFGAGANTFNPVFGETRNPWNPALNAAGSSGGSAVALATGIVALATGSDLGGSLRTPASFCSVVGFRPSPGRVAGGPGEAALRRSLGQRSDGAQRAGRRLVPGCDGGLAGGGSDLAARAAGAVLHDRAAQAQAEAHRALDRSRRRDAGRSA